jgi:hypothetical protein
MSRPQLFMRKRLADEVKGAQVRHHKNEAQTLEPASTYMYVLPNRRNRTVAKEIAKLRIDV